MQDYTLIKTNEPLCETRGKINDGIGRARSIQVMFYQVEMTTRLVAIRF